MAGDNEEDKQVLQVAWNIVRDATNKLARNHIILQTFEGHPQGEVYGFILAWAQIAQQLTIQLTNTYNAMTMGTVTPEQGRRQAREEVRVAIQELRPGGHWFPRVIQSPPLGALVELGQYMAQAQRLMASLQALLQRVQDQQLAEENADFFANSGGFPKLSGPVISELREPEDD